MLTLHVDSQIIKKYYETENKLLIKIDFMCHYYCRSLLIRIKKEVIANFLTCKVAGSKNDYISSLFWHV